MTRFIALLSGKGGVGKTTLSLALAKALTKLGKEVLVLDANLQTPNVGLHLGLLQPRSTLNQFLNKEKALQNVIHKHEDCEFSIIPSSPSFTDCCETGPENLNKIFDQLESTYDFVLVDCPSGMGKEVSRILEHTDETLLVVNPNTSSVMEALKSLELAKEYNNIVPGAVLNMIKWSRHELNDKEVEETLGVNLLAKLKHNKKVKKAANRSLPVNHLFPRSRSAKEIDKVAKFLIMEEN